MRLALSVTSQMVKRKRANRLPRRSRLKMMVSGLQVAQRPVGMTEFLKKSKVAGQTLTALKVLREFRLLEVNDIDIVRYLRTSLGGSA